MSSSTLLSEQGVSLQGQTDVVIRISKRLSAERLMPYNSECGQ